MSDSGRGNAGIYAEAWRERESRTYDIALLPRPTAHRFPGRLSTTPAPPFCQARRRIRGVWFAGEQALAVGEGGGTEIGFRSKTKGILWINTRAEHRKENPKERREAKRSSNPAKAYVVDREFSKEGAESASGRSEKDPNAPNAPTVHMRQHICQHERQGKVQEHAPAQYAAGEAPSTVLRGEGLLGDAPMPASPQAKPPWRRSTCTARRAGAAPPCRRRRPGWCSSTGTWWLILI